TMFITPALIAASLAVPTSMTVRVHAAPTVEREIVTGALEEAAAIWRGPGVALVWHIERDIVLSAAADGRTLPGGAALRVLFDDSPSTVKDFVGAFGCIVFDASNAPRPDLPLSYTNPRQIMRAAYGDGC